MFSVLQIFFILISVFIHLISIDSQNCGEISHKLYKCFSAKNTKMCFDNANSSLEFCQNTESRLFLSEVIGIMTKMEQITSKILKKSDLDQSCLTKLREIAHIHEEYTLRGFAAPDGCAYRKLLSNLADHQGIHPNCLILIQELEQALFRNSNCSVTTVRNASVDECIELHTRVISCARSYINCTNTLSNVHRCFDYVIDNIQNCKSELLRRVIIHGTHAWDSALKFYCTGHFTPITRSICRHEFHQITLKTTDIVPHFHTLSNCKIIHLHLQHIISLAPESCFPLLTNYTEHMLSQSDCPLNSTSKSNNCYLLKFLLMPLVLILFLHNLYF